MVRDSDGKEIGRIVDVLVEPSGQPRAVVVDAGGFLGVGARRVAVAWSTVHVPAPDSANEDVSIDMTDSQIRTAPSYTDRTKPAMIVGPAVPAAPAGAPAAPAAAAPAVAK
ncbi:MAG: PRC-barrel domain-containing protein [Acetobacteraceae bacterium]